VCGELISVQSFVKKPENTMKKFNMEDLYRNRWVSLRIFLTTPVSVGGDEWSTSKLKNLSRLI
jgi:hypothetical protein